jgi:DNA polymerase III subunit epsilon
VKFSTQNVKSAEIRQMVLRNRQFSAGYSAIFLKKWLFSAGLPLVFSEGLKNAFPKVQNRPMPVLIFDTETTGLVERRLSHDAEVQPDIVQIAALLCEGEGDGFKTISSLSLIVQPMGKQISAGAAKAHGISQGEANRLGVPATDALRLFLAMVDKADTLVAHNLSFDALVMRTAFYRALGIDMRDHLQNKRAFCTMRAMTPVCKILSPRAKHSTDFKWPTLTESYHYFFNRPLDGAHDASVDTRACAEIYFEILKRRKNE